MLILQEQDQNGFYEHLRFLILELCNLWRKFNVFMSELAPFVYMKSWHEYRLPNPFTAEETCHI